MSNLHEERENSEINPQQLEIAVEDTETQKNETLIKFTKYLRIPYFRRGNCIYFYSPFSSVKEPRLPPFSLGPERLNFAIAFPIIFIFFVVSSSLFGMFLNNRIMKGIYMGFGTVSVLGYVLIFITDGGVIIKGLNDNRSLETAEICSKCQVKIDKTCRVFQHCEKCDVCVKKLDHHCGFFGKCIGSRNLLLFYFVTFCTSLTMMSVYAMIIMYFFKVID